MKRRTIIEFCASIELQEEKAKFAADSYLEGVVDY